MAMKMHLPLLLICSTLFSISAFARQISLTESTPTTQTYTYVCHPSRFSNLGLNINDFAYCNSSLSYEVRVKDLVDRMTLNEKVLQLGDAAAGVARIGLPKYEWWSEALHGVSNVGHWGNIASFFDNVVPGATSFPTPIVSAASFNETLWKTIGQAVSTEARAMHNLGHAGLTFWSPNINVVRDPRWGRALETPGEDPFVVGRYAANYVRGLQDVEGTENTTDLNTRPLKVAACCKHYAAYDVDNWLGIDRLHFDARVTEQDMAETFVRPFEMCVKEGDVTSVMCSYNRVNGIPACADPSLLLDTIRGEWNLHGYIVSDCDSIEVMVDDHKWLADQPEDAVAQTLKAGLDLDCGDFYPRYTGNAVVQGKVKEAEVDKALKNLYVVLMRLGFFDGSPKFDTLDKTHICSEEHINLAIEAAKEGTVLLKNLDNSLPLDFNKISSLAVVGPHANATSVMIGNYAGVPCRYTSPLDALKEYKDVLYAEGCEGVACKTDALIWPAIQAAKKADATIIVAGIDLSIEAESLDRTDLLLPGYQTQLINQVAATSKGPVILVIMSAGGVDISFAKNNPNIKAIIWAGYPGEEGGHAIADIVFGKYNPGGKLPLTWYENNYVNSLPMTSMPLRPVPSMGYPGRTYKFFNGRTVYPFGYGLSYTNFIYDIQTTTRSLDISLNKFQHCRDLNYPDGTFKPSCPAVLVDDIPESAEQDVSFEVIIQNNGPRDGSETVLVYVAGPTGVLDAPIKKLIAFKKVFLAAGEKASVPIKFNVLKDLSLVDYKGYNLLPSGTHTIVIGDGLVSFPFSVNFKSCD